MANNDQLPPIALPPELQSQFARLEKRLWSLETGVAICGAGSALLGTWLGVFASDRLWDSPAWVRYFFAGTGTVGWGFAVTWWMKRWVFRRRDLRSLAKLVQRAHRRLGDRLLGIVELAGEKQHTSGFSPELYEAAIRQVATEAAKLDFDAAVSLRPVRAQATVLGVLILLVVPAVLLSPTTGWNVLQRWLRPWAQIPRRPLIEMQGLPAQMIVAHGENFGLRASVTYHSWWKPTHASAVVPGQPPIPAVVSAGQLELRIPGQIAPGTLSLRLGDAIHQVALQPTYRPTLRHLEAKVEWPEYLRRPPSSEKVEEGTLNVLESSRVTFQGEANRPLQQAQMRAVGGEASELPVNGARFASTSFQVANSGQVEFRWTDQLGLASAGPWRLSLQTRPDNAPVAELPDLARDIGLLETEVLQVKVAARDDFGVRDLGLQIELPPDTENASSASWPDFKSEAATPRPLEHANTFSFSPAIFHLPAPITVELRGFATDDWPGRAPSQSPAYRVHILSNEKHAEMVRQRMEALLAHLEEVARLQEKIAEDTRQLTEMSEEKQASRETGERIGGLNEQQKQTARSLEQLAREGMRNLREAIRNPTFKSDSVSDWAKTLQQMQQLAGQEMPKASSSLESARASQSQRSGKLGEAQQQAQKIAEALQKMQRQVNNDLDELQAQTLAQRLRSLGHGQKELSSNLEKIVPDTVGLLPKDLPPNLARANYRLSTNQVAFQSEAVALQAEISRFFERTRKPNYGEVSKQMKDLRTGEELDRLGNLITENIALDAMSNLGLWAKRFEDWGNVLEPPKEEENSSQGQGEGGNQEAQNRLLKMLMTLLRTRESQVTLREQTRVLDQQNQGKNEPTIYRESVAKLSHTEEELIGKVGGVRRDNPNVELGAPLAEAEMRMVETLTLLKQPRTDQTTLASHAHAVDALTDVINLINEQAKKNSSSSSPSESQGNEMKFLTQMMTQQTSQSQGMPMPGGGGNTAGGDTDSVSDGGPGDPTGRAADGRSPSRAGGATGHSVPAEFREALEDYYRALEKSEGRPQ